MSEFSVESEGVDVERIMEQIRARIRANRAEAASDAQVRQQASARAAQTVDPAGARSALAARPRPERAEPAPPPSESFEFDQDTLYRSSRGALGRALYGLRRLLSPLPKFFFNIQTVTHALAAQSRINRQQAAFDDRVARLFDTSSARLEAREEIDKLNHQVMLDLVAEMTRLSVEMKNHRALVESVSARLDFFERQARAAGGRAGAGSQPAEQTDADGRTEGAEPARRRRRRGRRRSGRATAAGETAAEASGTGSTEAADGAAAVVDGPSDAPEPTPQPPASEPAATALEAGDAVATATSGETAAAAPASTETAAASEPAATAPEGGATGAPAPDGAEAAAASGDANPDPTPPTTPESKT